MFGRNAKDQDIKKTLKNKGFLKATHGTRTHDLTLTNTLLPDQQVVVNL